MPNWIEAPAVTLLASTAFSDAAAAALLGERRWRHTASGAGDLLSEFAGRVCYDAFGIAQGRADSADYLGNILAHGHGSVLEHASATVHLAGVSRALTHELVRHRAGTAVSQESQRYVVAPDAFVVPPLILDQPALRTAWAAQCVAALAAYHQLAADLQTAETVKDAEARSARRRALRETARSVLPNSSATTIVFTANLRAWRHILALRGSSGADAEMRRLMVAILPVLVDVAPLVFADFTINPETGGLDCQYPKV